ncbi:MAG: 2-amino-4-hydroxy-6-hydroxymethyldihydropteridine diphosphokinase [SAR324 cluster bacterium]|nr:2-amino-4-hydroxy-6-hydroxymethyldihydropteridine diphosphokinase [SAR324 cluster bacterium]
MAGGSGVRSAGAPRAGARSVKVVIALGSNLEPESNLIEGVRLLSEAVRLTAASRVYRTPPWGYARQPDFLNAVAAADTELPPLALLDTLLEIEARLSRERTIPNGPRTLDLDLLFYGDRVLDSERLTLPHPRLHERAFVLVPLCDVLPEIRHPRLGKTARELLQAVDRSEIRLADLTLPV